MSEHDLVLIVMAVSYLGGGFLLGMALSETLRKWRAPWRKDDQRETVEEMAASLSGVTDVMRGVSDLAPRNAQGRLDDIREESQLLASAAKVEALAEEAYPKIITNLPGVDDSKRLREESGEPTDTELFQALPADVAHDMGVVDKFFGGELTMEEAAKLLKTSQVDWSKPIRRKRKPSPKKRAKKAGRK